MRISDWSSDVCSSDLVVGHRVWAFMPGDLPAIKGVIVKSAPGAVTMEVSEFLAALGLPRRSRWTWRRSVKAYQQEGTRTEPGVGQIGRAAGRGRVWSSV